jgi:prophage maintenance system killer protein
MSGLNESSQGVISEELIQGAVGKKTIHHMDFDTLVGINQAVVALSREEHGYTDADRDKLSALLAEVETRADNLNPEEAVPDKAALLMYKVASGQYFHAGNKRTALVSGVAFLSKNGYSANMRDPALVNALDKVGMAAATLDDLFGVLSPLLKESKAERRGWEKVVGSLVESNKDFLKGLAA